MGKSVHNKNHWAIVDDIRNKLDEGFPSCDNNVSKLIDKFNKIDEPNRTKGFEKFLTPLEAISLLVSSGSYPPPELMVWLVDCFDYYYQGKGNVSLEHVFFGREVQKTGNYAGRKANDFLFSSFEDWYRFNNYKAEVEGLKKPTQISAFSTFQKESFFGQHISEDIDPQSFLKGWRRWRSTKKTL